VLGADGPEDELDAGSTSSTRTMTARPISELASWWTNR